MPPRSQLPEKIKRTVFLKALEKNGFRIDSKGGKGSHIKVIHSNEKMIIIPKKIEKQTLYYILKEIESCTGVSWNDIKKYL
ncbi:MAG: type II toxin-antitoxin system HicA family toxin [Candidatus Moranbacteria bacterium]|nr:type II toxin-antitoxin system HicA family toxin [Candidatus Moranbacteria bacterium]